MNQSLWNVMFFGVLLSQVSNVGGGMKPNMPEGKGAQRHNARGVKLVG